MPTLSKHLHQTSEITMLYLRSADHAQLAEHRASLNKEIRRYGKAFDAIVSKNTSISEANAAKVAEVLQNIYMFMTVQQEKLISEIKRRKAARSILYTEAEGWE